ncbi:type II toxin-antitoxin system RelE/ParE family toxin [Candidatus Lokiarchaeum ossiferum]|uniref:type II toxin-antitoxin system RelE/ParE family toxin n=1 Tax=Candidatus Lokiarchaeum ossiferum TaxID=2951803 RepID=UPI00352F852E
MIQVIFHPDAKKDLENGIIYYDSQVFGLGYNFLEEVEHLIKNIQKFPKCGKILRNNVRQIVLQRFPYMILYIFKENQIYIVAVAHQNQKPYYWKSRVKSNL